MALEPCTTVFKLNTGASIPAIGLGTWKATNPAEARDAVYLAIKHGYRHIDTAYVYGNEKDVGEGIRRAISEGIVKREELFVTTKLWCFDHPDPLSALKSSVERLGLEYVDLYLMHWPIPLNKKTDSKGNIIFLPPLEGPERELFFKKDWTYLQTWAEMEKLVETGLTKAIGVSNFTAKRLESLCKSSKIVPACNQVQLHPLLPGIELFEVAKKFGVILEAYSPLGSLDTPLLKDPLINKIAEKNGIPSANVIFSWIVSRGIVVLPKSVKEERIISNLKVTELPKEDLDALTSYAASRGGETRIGTSVWIPKGFWEDEY